MDKLRAIIVPTNKKAMNELDFGIEYDKVESDDYIFWYLSENEFLNLWNSKVFDSINDECDAMIDDYEDDLIAFDKLLAMKNAINKHSKKTFAELKRLSELLELAIAFETCINFAF